MPEMYNTYYEYLEADEPERFSETDNVDYEYLGAEEARYQGYDSEEAEELYGFSVRDSVEDIDEGTDFGEEEQEASENQRDFEETDDGTGIAESYTIDGRVFKDLRQYILRLYQKDVSCHPLLDSDEQIELARVIRRGMLCDCHIMPEDPKVPEEYPYKLVDKTSRVLRRLHQTEEEKAWVEGLTDEELQKYISEGRAAQDKLISSNLPLVMDIASDEYNQMEYLDRVQAGNIGLTKAAQYFNPNKGFKFSTFATKLIVNEIRDQSKELKMQKAGPKTWKNHVATENDINRVCERMGGNFWMREITVDTDLPVERIRRQVGALLEQKVLLESVANGIISGIPENYDEILSKISVDGDPVIDRSSRIGQKTDIITGDGKPPKDNELSFEDYVRSFFRMSIKVKDVAPERLGSYVLRNYHDASSKREELRQFLLEHWEYTDKAAITELPNLIKEGCIWPELVQIERTRIWAGEEASDRGREDYRELLDTNHPTEAMAIILSEGYVPVRQADILKEAEIAEEYYSWICEIINICIRERLDGIDRELLEDIAQGEKYETIQARHQISPNTIKEHKDEIFRCIYDQTMESANCKNGQMLMKRLMLEYQASVVKKWKKSVLDRMVRDHYLDKEQFALRSRGEADSHRPPMEIFLKMTDRIHDAEQTVAEVIPRLLTPVRKIGQMLHEFIDSEEYAEWVRQWEEDGEDFDLDDEEDMTLDSTEDMDLESTENTNPGSVCDESSAAPSETDFNVIKAETAARAV